MMIMNQSLLAALLLASGSVASPVGARTEPATETETATRTSPTAAVYNWSVGWTQAYPIHPSCNATLRAQLAEGLDETVQLAKHARDHLLRWGSKSDLVQKYFGNASSATPIGWYERVVSADKTGMTFRCDDPDQNCATQDGWAGHWRGENATSETVICPLSFAIRRSLSSVCGLGYNVAGSKLNTFWATDLLHRVLHVPAISESIVGHFAEDYADVISLAKSDPSKSVFDSDVLQYFAIEAWAYDIAAPGVGCPGELDHEHEHEHDTTTATATAAPTTTSSAAKECHTHDDGVVHCD
ncbi:major allergen asp f 2-like protein [Ophiostoma piceae UAMH 11346]|uniref:Major allergen asp f 2-like protein n=1 Tax=Ophiostoma piceae (strain UAMH 11346) TaxID=1262450 RepID=S3D556_OPHP1|nr:major allergen asp f 2-like protein [Ophiostoma piceae UAMH 11346]